MNLLEIKSILKDKEKLQNIGTGIAMGFLVIIIYYLLFLRPQLVSLKKYGVQIASLKQNIASASRIINNIDNLKQERDRLSRKISQIEEKIPGHKEIALLLEYISNMARESEVKIVSLEPVENDDDSFVSLISQEEQENMPFSEVHVLIWAKCGYHHFGTFVNRIENSSIMKVKEFKIESSARDPYNHSVKILVNMLVLKEKEG